MATTIWDQIYQKYQKGGEAWASLAEGIHPLFKRFLRQSAFKPPLCVLDIGCGTGKYLKLLQAGGFKTDGIDSSKTAVTMAQKSLGKIALITVADMFKFKIPKDKYNLIISIAAIHHGTKKQVQNLINNIYEVLVDKGKIFITLPDWESSNKWETFKNYKKVAEGTFAPLQGPERGLLHSFYKKEEIQKMFAQFANLQMGLDSHGRWIIQASKLS